MECSTVDTTKARFKALPLQFRFLNTGDIEELKLLCKSCFPLDYPHYWFTLITSDCRFYSLAAMLNGKIVGMLVAEVKCKCQVQYEHDSDILASSFGPDTPVAYILSLGVHPLYRRKGIATELFQKLMTEMSTGTTLVKVKAIYLHVLATNLSAIRFYLGLNFQRWRYLKSYYVIDGQFCDGFSYVLYTNGGRPPWSYSELIANTASALQDLQPCKITVRFMSWIISYFTALLPGCPKVVSPTLHKANCRVL
ncbi:N-alpha-acetyltransferase 60-like [Styela clava]